MYDENVMNIIYESIGIDNNNDIILDEEYQQLLNEHYEDLDLLDESRIFLSNQGLKIKKQIKEKTKEIGTKGTLNKIKKGLTQSYDIKQVNEIHNFCNRLFDKLYNSPILEVHVTTYVNGVVMMHYEYYTYSVGIKGNYLYSFTLFLTGSNTQLSFLSFNEVDLTEGNISLELANDVMSILKQLKGYPSVIKNGFVFQKTIGKQDRTRFSNALKNLLDKKYPNLRVTGNIFTGSVKIKPK